MARTLDPAVHALRRDEFVDVALRLMQTKGWDATSIADVLAETGASKGAFYHYFSSKADLLEAVIERITDAATASLHPAIDAPELSADRALRARLRRHRPLEERADRAAHGRRRDVERRRQRDRPREVPARASSGGWSRCWPRSIEQGQTEGRFAGLDPESTGRVLVALMLGANETATDLYFDRHGRRRSRSRPSRRRLGAYQQAFERVLDLPSGSLVLVDRDSPRPLVRLTHVVPEGDP